jgi:hypothetical protein
MKKIILCALGLLTLQFAFAQKKCNLTTDKPWIVLNGQMVNSVHPPIEGVSSYVLSIKSTDAAGVEIVQTEEMATVQKTETINGLQRWFVTYKKGKARTITTVVIKCGCEVFVRVLEQPVRLSNL